MKWRVVGAIVLAFWPLSVSASADVSQQGDTIQFSYMWGSYEQTFTDSIVTVTVTNNITNKIGGNGEVIDTYRITVGDQRIEVTEKHDARQYTYSISGSQTIRLEGIDNGFWAGYYGPIMSITSEPIQPVTEPSSESATTSEPITESPVTESATTSEVVTESATVSDDVSESPTVSESVVILPPAPEPTPEATPSAEPQPAPIPEPIYSPEPLPIEVPQPELTPTLEPTPEPTATPETPEPLPTLESTPTSTPTPEASQTPQPQPTLLPIPQPTSPEILSPVYPTEEPSETPIEPATQTPQVTEETESESVSGAVETVAAQVLGAGVKAVGELVSAVTSAGLDMTPQKREEAQEVVVSAIIVSQVAQAASVSAVRRMK
jgi:hypothetical protein